MTGPLASVMRYKMEYLNHPEGLSLWTQAPSGERLRLRPLQATGAGLRARDLELLTEWRNRYRPFFLTDFTATVEQTQAWLLKSGADPSRILFMIEREGGSPFGHAGLCNLRPADAYAELDNVVRGADGPRGAMTAAVTTLCDWAVSSLGVTALWVRVMSDNPAVSFYEKVGFRRAYDVALEFHRDGSKGIWMERPDRQIADRYLRYMERAA
ncbi:MAG: GNAT family N-acetyltransferase [Chloroflexi bacterium]|nr:MAG: GNAT family N-acetyltransferase [Chloroflexota bacterium]